MSTHIGIALRFTHERIGPPAQSGDIVGAALWTIVRNEALEAPEQVLVRSAPHGIGQDLIDGFGKATGKRSMLSAENFGVIGCFRLFPTKEELFV